MSPSLAGLGPAAITVTQKPVSSAIGRSNISIFAGARSRHLWEHKKLIMAMVFSNVPLNFMRRESSPGRRRSQPPRGPGLLNELGHVLLHMVGFSGVQLIPNTASDGHVLRRREFMPFEFLRRVKLVLDGQLVLVGEVVTEPYLSRLGCSCRA